MTKAEIRKYMVSVLNDKLQDAIDDLELEELVDRETIDSFIEAHDTDGLIEDYIDYHTDEIVDTMLEEIFEDIDESDLDAQW